MKKKILLISDVPNWIFSRHCYEIIKRMPQYDFTILYREHIFEKPRSFFNRFNLIYLLDIIIKIPDYVPLNKTVVGIRCEFAYEHSVKGIKQFYDEKIKPRFKAFHVVNKKQYKEFCNVSRIPIFYAPHGVDINLFRPVDIKNQLNHIVVGTNGSKKSKGKKGFDIIESVCRKFNIPLLTTYQDLKNGHLEKEDMVIFYNNIDIYINMSESEGLNNSILEAGAMGKCVIATNVGGVPEIINHNVNGLICMRTEFDLERNLIYLIRHKNKILEMGNNLKTLIHQNYSWDVCIKNYENLFNSVLRYQ